MTLWRGDQLLTDYFEPVFRPDATFHATSCLTSPSNDCELLRADPNLNITARAYLGEPGGYRQFIEEHLTGLNSWVQFIHTKCLLIDPLTDHPVVVTGSANFSTVSTIDNDENMLVIGGDRAVAAACRRLRSASG